jgi:hypothetical protein
MNMQDFYQQLSVKAEQPHQRRLEGLTRASRTQILHVTSELTWYIWGAEASNT